MKREAKQKRTSSLPGACRRLLAAGRRLAWVALVPLLFMACSETEDEEVNEFNNWEARNSVYWASLEDSLRQGSDWLKLKTFTKDEATAGEATDYIYVHVLQSGASSASPLYNDSVRVAYRGRFIPSASYPEGYVFDQSYYGSYSLSTVSTAKFKAAVPALIDGWVTALLHMHRGDRWQVYIPYTLAYGAAGRTSSSSGSVSVPGYSTLIFDMTLIDHCHPHETLPVWNARRR